MLKIEQEIQPYQIMQFLESGIGVSVNAKDYPAHTLVQFLQSAKTGETTMILRNASTLKIHQLSQLGMMAKGRLIIEL